MNLRLTTPGPLPTFESFVAARQTQDNHELNETVEITHCLESMSATMKRKAAECLEACANDSDKASTALYESACKEASEKLHRNLKAIEKIRVMECCKSFCASV